MKATELIKKLQDHVAKHGDCNVACIDIEGNMTPMKLAVWVDTETNDLGIEGSCLDGDYDAFGHGGIQNGEWDDDEWEEKKEDFELIS